MAGESVGLAECEGIALKVVAGDEYLSCELLLCHLECTLVEGTAAKCFQFAADKASASLNLGFFAAEIDAPYACVLIAEGVALSIIYKSVLLSQADIEEGVHARTAKDIVEQEEGCAVVMIHAVTAVAHEDMCLVGVALTNGHLRMVRGQGHQWLADIAALQGGGVALYLSDYFVEIYLAKHKESGIVGDVIFAGEAQGIVGGVLAQTLCLAEDVAPKTVGTEEHLLEVVVDEFGGGVVVAVNLVNDDFYFLVYLVLRIDAMEDYVAEQIDSTGEVVALHGGVEDCYLFICESIEITANTFEVVAYMPGSATLCTLECHVLAEMRHARVALILVTGAGGYDITAIDNIGRRRLMDKSQSVG